MQWLQEKESKKVVFGNKKNYRDSEWLSFDTSKNVDLHISDSDSVNLLLKSIQAIVIIPNCIKT